MNKLSPRLSLISLCLMSAYSFSTHAEESQQTTVLDEITVTGEKFERSQSSTGSSTTVVTDDQFKREANLMSATQLLKRDVNILDTGLGNDLPTVRGVDGSGPAVGAVAFFAGSRPRLNMQIDGRTSSYNELAFGTINWYVTTAATVLICRRFVQVAAQSILQTSEQVHRSLKP